MLSPLRNLPDGSRADDPSLARIGAFSDGVYAFGITLLVLAIRIPRPTDVDAGHGLLVLLTEQWRSYIAFAISFMLIGLTWANHRVMFANFARADHVLVWLNLAHLMVGVAFMPIPTAVLGAWLGNQQNEAVAAVFYGGAATLGALLFNVVWWYGAYVARLTHPDLTTRERHAHTLAWALAPILLAILAGLAFISPPAAVIGYAVVIVLYVLPLPTLVSMAKRRLGR